MNIYWIAHCITNPALWKKFSFFAGVRVTWGWDKLVGGMYVRWLIAEKQLYLAHKHNQRVIASIMPERKIGSPHFENYCKQLKKRFGGVENITWCFGTEPGTIAKYDYEQYRKYYKIAVKVFGGTNIFTAPGFTLISNKQFKEYKKFMDWQLGHPPFKYFPAPSIHLYDSHRHRKSMLEKVLKLDVTAPGLWIAETGWSSESKWWHWFARTNGEKEQLKNAKRDLQMYEDMGIEVVILYNWEDDPKAKNKFCKHAGLLRADGTEKPLFEELKKWKK